MMLFKRNLYLIRTGLTPQFLKVVITLSSLYVGMGCAPTLKERLNTQTLVSPISKQYTIRVDTDASEIRWNVPADLNLAKPKALRAEIASHLESALNTSSYSSDLQKVMPLRFLLEVHSIKNNYGWMLLPCVIYFTIIGCPIRSTTAEITFSVEYQGRVYQSNATGVAYFNLYNGMLHKFKDLSPVADALSIAVQDIAQEIRVSKP